MNTLYSKARFLASAANIKQAPGDLGSEVAFAGRSNSGKSSAINAITSQKSLARVSKTPGRTQLLNFFEIDGSIRLVDLPGYGYAKVPVSVQKTWGQMIETYLSQRKSLRGVFLIMDIRHPLTDFDWYMLNWCRHLNLSCHIALTKADKLSRGAGLDVVRKIRLDLKQFNSETDNPPTLQVFSSLKHLGIQEAHAALDKWLLPER